MKKISFLLCLTLILVILLSACNKNDDVIFQKSTIVEEKHNQTTSSIAAVDGAKPSSLSGKLFLRVNAEESPFGDTWKNKFCSEYPNVDVSMDAVVKAGQSYPQDWIDQANTRAIVDLTSGTAQDVIEITHLTYQKFAKSGLFTNFYTLMESDPAFKTEDYYTNVFEIYESADNALYVLPPNFAYMTYVFDTRITQRLGIDVEKEYAQGISPNEVMDIYQNGLDSGLISSDTVIAKGCAPNYFDWQIMPEFIESKSLKVHFDTPKFTDFLKRLDTLRLPVKLGSGVHESSIFESLYTAELYLFSEYPLHSSEFGKQEQMPHESASKPIFAIGNNKYIPSYGIALFAIPISAQNPALAWEYLKFMVAEKDMPTEIDCLNQNNKDNLQKVLDYCIPNPGMPINRNNCKKLIQACWGEEVMKKYDAHNMALNCTTDPLGGELDEAFYYIRASFFTDHSITAEECAKQMQERAEMFVNE